MTIQRVAQLFAVVFLAVGVLGLVTTPLNMAGGILLSLFPVNVLHNLVHLAFGVWALAAARSFSGAKTFARVGGVIYLALVVLSRQPHSVSCRSVGTTSGFTG